MHPIRGGHDATRWRTQPSARTGRTSKNSGFVGAGQVLGPPILRRQRVLTLLTSLFGGYFQYLNAYQDKVSTQAKEDMTAATATFTEVSNSFAEMQALQQILYSDFTSAVRDKSDASDHALSSKNAKEASDTYEKARTTLRENVDVLARKAEVYIDWASDI